MVATARLDSTARSPQEAASTDGAASRLQERLNDGDPTALAELYDLYSRRIFGLALWWSGPVEEAEEVVQETFVRVWEKRRLVAKSRDLEAYVLRMARMVAIARHRRRRPTEPLEEAALVYDVSGDPERRLDAERLSRHLRSLSPKLRAVVYLHGYLDLSFRRAGRVLGIPTFTAASRYRLAVERLRSLMEVFDDR